MIDILYNKLRSCSDLKSCSDTESSEWKDVSPEIFNRHSQHSQHSQHSRHSQHSQHSQEHPQHSQEHPKEIEKPPTQPPVDIPIITKMSETPVSKTSKATTIKPLDILMSETMSFHTSADYIKESIITLITRDEFSKIFGMTKCAEIMSGVVNNRWNKSTALFISFFLDKEVYYNEKVIVYNKEKNKGRVSI
jgi:hypothetical protein